MALHYDKDQGQSEDSVHSGNLKDRKLSERARILLCFQLAFIQKWVAKLLKVTCSKSSRSMDSTGLPAHSDTETASFGRNTWFRPTFWPNICRQNSLFRAKEAVLAEKSVLAESRKGSMKYGRLSACFLLSMSLYRFGDAGCRTGNGITSQPGHTWAVIPFPARHSASPPSTLKWGNVLTQ